MMEESRNLNPNSLTRTRFRSTLKDVKTERKRDNKSELLTDEIAEQMDFVAEQLAMDYKN